MNKTKHRKIIDIFKNANGYARTMELIHKGMHIRDIESLVEKGDITRVKSGLYKLSTMPVISNQGFIDISLAIPEGIICLTSALSYYELTTLNPTTISVAIYRKSWKPKIKYPPVEFYYFSKKQFDAGINTIKIKKHNVKIYSPEKTICDCFRYRNKLGIDIAKEGLSEYLKWKNRDLEKLMEYASVCRVRPLLKTWLDAMV